MDAEALTVPRLLQQHAATRTDARFVIAGATVSGATVAAGTVAGGEPSTDALTYAGLDRASRTVAARLVDDGVGTGTRVGVLMGNSVDWVVVAFAVMRVGGVLVPLSTLLTPRELAATLRIARVEHLLVAPRTRSRDHLADLAAISPRLVPDHGPVHAPELPRLRTITVCSPTATTLDRRPPSTDALDLVDAFEALVHPSDDLVVIFTSGSRGSPKGVVHTHGGALGAIHASLGPRCIGASDTIYIPMPFFWMGGFGGGLITAFVAGATLITEGDTTPEQTLRLLERERVTLFRGWPDQAAALAAHPAFATADLSSLRPGSLDPVLPAELRAAPGTRGVLFGMTETFGPYCADPLDQLLPPGKHGSLGRPFAGIEVRITDPDTGRPLPAGDTGEIQVRGPNVMRAICGRRREHTFTPDGFYPTGDSGRLDADGYLWFAGRLDDMIKVRGATVYPSEVEEALEAIDHVSRAFAVDIVVEGATRVGAAVVLEPDRTSTVGDLAAAARMRLSAFKVPARWQVIHADDVPRTPTGKVDKDALRALVEAGS